MEKTSVTVILTCFNRKDKTVKCLESLSNNNPRLDLGFIVVDDHSMDGTVQALLDLKKTGNNIEISIIQGDGNLYWAGGMRKGMLAAKSREKSDYYLLVNDDVLFYDFCIEKMIDHCAGKVLVGPTCDQKGNLTYSGIRYTGKGISYEKVTMEDTNRSCDTFNANCVLIPGDIFMNNPIIDEHYIHSLGDFDYGLTLKKEGILLQVHDEYVGICESNSSAGTWEDSSLSRMERIRKKEQVKGAPGKQWYYFLKKNFGFYYAWKYSITPYLRILLGK